MSATKTVSVTTGTYYYNEDADGIYVTTGTVVKVVFSGEKIYFNTTPVSTDYITVSIDPDDTSSSNTATEITVTYTCKSYISNLTTTVNAVVVDSSDNSVAQINVIAVEDPSSYKSSSSSSIFDNVASSGYITLSVGESRTLSLLDDADSSYYIYLAQVEKAYTYYDGTLTEVNVFDSKDNGYVNLDTIIALYTRTIGLSDSYIGCNGYAYTDDNLGYGDLMITAADSITDSNENAIHGVAVVHAKSNTTTSDTQVGGRLTVYVTNGTVSFFPLTITVNPETMTNYSTAADETVTITYSNFLNRPVEYFYTTKTLEIGTTYTAYVTLTDTSGNTSTLTVTGQEEITVGSGTDYAFTFYAFTFDDNITLVGETYDSVSITITAVSTANSFSAEVGSPNFLVNMVVSEYKDESTFLVYCGTTGSESIYLNHTQSGYYSDIHAESTSDNDPPFSAYAGTVTTEVVYTDADDEADMTEPYTLLQSVDWELATEDDDLADLISVSLDSSTGVITVKKKNSGTTAHDANTIILTLYWNTDYASAYSDDITSSVVNGSVVCIQTIELDISANEVERETNEVSDETSVVIAYTDESGVDTKTDATVFTEVGEQSLTIQDGSSVTVTLSGFVEEALYRTYSSGYTSTTGNYYYIAEEIGTPSCDSDSGFTVSRTVETTNDDGDATVASVVIQDTATGENTCSFFFIAGGEFGELVSSKNLTNSFAIEITSSISTPSYVVISDLTDLENATVNTLRDDYSGWSFAEEFTANPSNPTAFYKDVTTGSSTTQIVVFYIPEDYTVYTTQWEDDSELTEGTSTDNDDPLFLLVSEGTIRALSLPCGTDTTDERTFTITSGDIDGTCTLVVKRVEALSDYE